MDSIIEIINPFNNIIIVSKFLTRRNKLNDDIIGYNLNN